MRYIATGQEVFRIDEFTTNVIGIPQLVLMERAALRIAEHVKERFPAGAHVLIVVESGNNGGDGLAAGRILMMEGYDVEIYWVDGLKSASTGFDAQYAIAKKLNMKFVDELVNAGYDVIIDGIFGVGLSRAVMGRQAEVIKALNDMDGYKLAIDVPSGIDATTGFLLGTAFHADATVTFGLMKLGLLMGMGYEYAGEVSVVDIGFPKQAIDFVEPRLYTYDPKDVEELLPHRKRDSHKGTYGKVGIIAGSKNMAGAALFSAEAAYRMGCGLVRVCTVEENREIIQSRLPEALLTTYKEDDIDTMRSAMKTVMGWADVLVLGPGLGTGEAAQYLVDKVLRSFDGTVVLDADGINVLSEHMDLFETMHSKLILTPHLMEMSRLTNQSVTDIKANKYDLAREFAKRHNVVVALKDARTVVSDGGLQAYINITGTNGMATGGSGDVLTGIIAGLLAQGMDRFEATKLGVCMHGMAGQAAAEEKGQYSMIAGDIVRSIEQIIAKEAEE